MYQTSWNSAHPGHVVFLLDLSGSMAQNNRIDHAIEALRQTLKNIEILCKKVVRKSGEKPSSMLRERITVSVYGYNYQVKCLGSIKNWGPKQIGTFLSEAKSVGRTIFDVNGEAKPEYQTCMCAAFVEAKRDIEEWLSQQSASEMPAPIVINITDGYPYEGKEFDQNEVFERTLRAAKDLMNIRTNDGPVRVFNIHYAPGGNETVLRFPNTKPTHQNPGEERVLNFLYDASSLVTANMAKALSASFPEVTEGARAMISNENNAGKLAMFINVSSTLPLSSPAPEADVN
jgi:uncharacterized protein YegL